MHNYTVRISARRLFASIALFMVFIVLVSLSLYDSVPLKARADGNGLHGPVQNGCSWKLVGTATNKGVDIFSGTTYILTTSAFASYDYQGNYCGSLYGTASVSTGAGSGYIYPVHSEITEQLLTQRVIVGPLSIYVPQSNVDINTLNLSYSSSQNPVTTVSTGGPESPIYFSGPCFEANAIVKIGAFYQVNATTSPLCVE